METNGIVLGHYTNGTSGKGNRFWVDCQFGAQDYTGSAPVSESEWVAYQPGRPIAVWYLPDDSDIHALSPRGALWHNLIFCLLGIFILSIGVWGTFAVMALTIRHAFLRETEEPRSAKVTRQSGGGSYPWTALWRDETGQTGTIIRMWRVNLPETYSTITIYADPSGKLPSVWEGDCGAR